MIYLVTARFRIGTASLLLERLRDGTISQQHPDGLEIIDSMERAVISGDGFVRWTETCYCQPPLRHERRTVLDSHFTEINVTPATGEERLAGGSFMNFLVEESNRS